MKNQKTKKKIVDFSAKEVSLKQIHAMKGGLIVIEDAEGI